MDWNRLACATRGHLTYAPTEPDLHDHLRATTPVGEAWRCLRCGDFVLGEPTGSGPAAEAPAVRRGRELRDAVIIRLLAIERGVRALVLFLLAYGVWRFKDAEATLSQVFERDLPAAKPLADKLGIDLGESGAVARIRQLLHTDPHTLQLLALALLAYGTLELVEAVGLWLMRRWGEYVAVVGTSVLLPLEIYELLDHATWFKIGGFAVNLAAVAWLLWTKRLFGIRGGRAALDAERHELSLLEVRTSAGEAA